MTGRSKTSPRVSVLVLNWNGIDFTAACYRSLLRLEPVAETEIVVIDNGSTAHTADDLRAACPEATLLPLPGNLGFAGGMNAGIREALRRGADFVWLLNNDTVCEPTALASLLAPMGDERTGIVSSRLRQGAAEGGRPGTVLRGGSTLRPPFYVPFPPSRDEEPDFLCGASLLVRAAALREIGPLDEGFPFFFEDADYSYRARELGWRLAESARPDVVHMGSATIGRMSRKKARCYRLGHLRFLRRHARHPLLSGLPSLLWRLAGDAIRLDGEAVAGSLEGWREGLRCDMAVEGAIE